MIKKNIIYFLDVNKEEEGIIKKELPQAIIINNILGEKKLAEKIKEAEIICTSTREKISSSIIKSLKNLKFIITRSVGYDHINLKSAKENNIMVANIPDYGAHVIAEFVFALLLSGLRNVDKADRQVENTYKFFYQGLKGRALFGKTLGIIGTGNIGSKVAKIASLGFNMKVIAHSKTKRNDLAKKYNFKYVNLSTIWKKSDIISLHCPLLAKTKHIINKNSLAKMKTGVIIVNTSRGALIKTKDLTKAIKNKKVANAFLDVIEHEDNIKRNKELIDLEPVIVTPHIAFYADDSAKKQYKLAIETIKVFLNKKKNIPGQITGI